MKNRNVRAGQSIRLLARFKDDLGDNAQAGDVYVHIFEPDEITTDLNNALVVSGVPTYRGDGIFEYEYTTPSCGPEGTWQDLWFGELTCQTLSGLFNFNVVADGAITSINNQLFVNNIIEVEVASGIMATDGTYLTDEYSLEFMTTTNPSHSSLRKVRLEVGSFITDLYDDVIQTAILEASIEADLLSFVTTKTNDNLYQHARREYTTCLASMYLIQNTSSNKLKSKTLADLSVDYDTSGGNDMLDRLRGCLDKWFPQLTSGGGANAAKRPGYFVKGGNDPDRPVVSRMWESTDNGSLSRRIPAANTKSYPSQNSRRKVRTFNPRNSKRWW